ncbi:probable cationic amino acid transporter isoform X2 [Phlebotomus papatasi]|uniref:probable cationic amino acid transporter isoform X2 n=1 Tax=Phlebotomus papatasi TaxID=29031 RepID=UPI00248462E0|nr:probable cationic amino acid transporter isoform X2 [Phlebotomus papatasi]
MIFTAIPYGTGSRWALGSIILVHQSVYNEIGATTTLFAILIAALSATFSAICRSATNKTSNIGYLRANHKCDFLLLFLTLWMDILALLASCGALARTLSTCLDTMTGGMARMWILGRNSSPNEPWPDVIGVSVVFLVSGMFMLGLENTKIFSCLMISGVLGIIGQLGIVTWLQGDEIEWHKETWFPQGTSGIIIGAALCAFSFPAEMPTAARYNRLTGILIILVVTFTSVLTAACLSTLVHFKPETEFLAVPVFKILTYVNLTKVIPAMACLLVLTCSGALMELFPEMYALIVKLTTSEWKILAKQIGYESRDSGSPVLAIFTGGSLCAMLAFACPMENLIYILAGSHLMASIFRALYLLYTPYRPKCIQHQESSLAYTRLQSATAQTSQNIPTSASTSRRLWCFRRASSVAVNMAKSRLQKKPHDEELEREWLLLGEPPSPRCLEHPDRNDDAESSILSDDGDQAPASEDSTTDIDAIVDEYRQKIKVSMAGPLDKNQKTPSVTSWRVALIGILFIVCGIASVIFGVIYQDVISLSSGLIGTFFANIMLFCLPRHNLQQGQVSSLTATLSIILSCVLLTGTLSNSWAALLFWITAGFIFCIRCDSWCCLCLDRTTISAHSHIIPNVSAKLDNLRQKSVSGIHLPNRIPTHR